MSATSNVVAFPDRCGDRVALEHDIVLALATADDLAAAMDRVVEAVLRGSGANRVEWWAPGTGGRLQLRAAIGIDHGRRHDLAIDGAGTFVLYGDRVAAEATSILQIAAPIIRRRAAEERLAQTAVDLARRNQALEDFAALVAHELKAPLQAALLADDPSADLESALDLVEALLDAARTETHPSAFGSAAELLEHAVEDLASGIKITTDVQTALPLPVASLSVILRNLLANAAAAGAHHVHVAAIHSARSWRLLVDDDGVGLAQIDRYAAGSGLGLALSRRIAGRFGGVIELASRSSGGTRATVEFTETTS